MNGAPTTTAALLALCLATLPFHSRSPEETRQPDTEGSSGEGIRVGGGGEGEPIANRGQGLGPDDGQASSRQATPPFGASRGGRGTRTGTSQLEHAAMRVLPQQATLVFDGGCGVCTRSVRAIKSLDGKGRITAVPYQKTGVPASAGLTAEACRRAAWAVTPEGHRYGGAGAVNVALAVALGTKLPFAFYRLPLIGHAQDRVYDWIAANRRRLPGDEPHCSQHPGDCA